DAEATAALAAPCITTAEFQADETYFAGVKAVLRGAVLRWHDAGSGVLTQQGAGPFQQSTDTRTIRKGMFWPSEIADLRDLCSRFAGGEEVRAFSFRPARTGGAPHQPWCAIHFGAGYCSCGADLTDYQYPLYEGGALS